MGVRDEVKSMEKEIENLKRKGKANSGTANMKGYELLPPQYQTG